MATAELTREPKTPVAVVRPAAEQFPETEWLNRRNVPVFSEHSTRDHKGKVLNFGRAELAAVCDNCNRRINETGDYAAIVVGHTVDPDVAPDAPQLPLVGLAGPFRMGRMETGDGQSKWAILADFHIRREHADVLRKYPRRSPELWVEDSYDEMYLDPISLLGAETPRLDLGLLYSARRASDGRYVEKYSACAPSASSVFVPSDDATDRKQYAADAAPSQTDKEPAMTPEDLSQIVAAIEQTDWAQWCKAKMQAEQPADNPEQFAADQKPDEALPESVVEPEAPPVAAEAAVEQPIEAAPEPAPAIPPAEDDDEALPVKYSRLASQVGTLNQEVEQLQQKLRNEESRRVNTERYSALRNLRQTRQFDLKAEFDLLKYGKASDEQFNSHIQRITDNYRPIPVGESIPLDDSVFDPATPGGAATKQRYSKEHADRATAICKDRLRKGEPADFNAVLQEVVDGKA